MTTRYQ